MGGRNRQARALRLMRKLAVRMARKMDARVDQLEVDALIDVRNDYYDAVGRIDDLLRRFDLVSIIA